MPSILPAKGNYFVPGHGGTGINIDVDRNGYVFAIFYGYDPSGSADYFLMQGQYQPAADPTQGTIGSFDASP